MASKPPSSKLNATNKDEATFSEVVKLIAASKQKAFQAVNTTLIDLYWKIGATISRKIGTAEWGDGVVERLAQFIARTEPGLRGFTIHPVRSTAADSQPNFMVDSASNWI